jgi:hypothetical protein
MSIKTTKRESLVAVWAAAWISIFAWLVHQSGSAALVRQSCTHASAGWLLHGLTVITALICIGCGAIGLAALRKGRRVANSTLQFLGGLVAVIALANLVLILWEGSYTTFLPACR